jgi:hypothetical protein
MDRIRRDGPLGYSIYWCVLVGKLIHLSMRSKNVGIRLFTLIMPMYIDIAVKSRHCSDGLWLNPR